MIYKEEAMPLVLEAVAKNLGPLHKVAGLSGMSERTLFRWLRDSAANPNEWLVDYEGERIPFHQAFKIAQYASRFALRAKALHMVQEGESVPLFNDGLPVFQVDLELAALAQNPKMWEIVFGDTRPITDIYARDSRGRLKQAQARLATNAHVLTRVLQALDPDFADRRSIDVSHRGGVLVIGERQPQQQQSLPRPQPEPPVRLERQQPVDAEYSEIEPPSENRPTTETAGEFAEGPEGNDPAETPTEFREADAMTQDEKMQPQPGDSPMLADLKARYWANRERVNGGEIPAPSAPVSIIPAVDDDPPDAQAERVSKPKVSTAALDERVKAILGKRARGEPMTAIERQVCSGHDRGNLKYVASLLAPRRDGDGIGSDSKETVKPGGYRAQ